MERSWSLSKHVIITGPGRCGTTLVTKALTELGFDTGYPKGRAFLDVRNRDWHWPYDRNGELILPLPYIIKDPYLCRNISSISHSQGWEIEHVYVLLRSLEGTTNSRWILHEGGKNVEMPKKFEEEWETRTKDDVANLFLQLAKDNIPHTLLWYPQLAKDPNYMFEKLKYLMDQKKINFNLFEDLHSKLIDSWKIRDQ